MNERIRQVLSQRKKSSVVDASLTQSAVLLPLYKKAGEYHLLFTLRTDKLSAHKGQVSFPGGRCHGDETPLSAAIRETWEEIGVRPEDVEVLGELDDAVTLVTKYVMHPFVGVIPYPYQLVANHDEVEEIIAVPIATLMDTSCYGVVGSLGPGDPKTQLARFYEGRPSMGWFYEFDGHVVWGATARIVKGFLELISGGE